MIGHGVVMEGNRIMTSCLRTSGGHCLSLYVSTLLYNRVFKYTFFRSQGLVEARLVFLLIFMMNLSNIPYVLFGRQRTSHCNQDSPCDHSDHIAANKQTSLVLQMANTFHTSWILLMLILLRPHNMCLVAMVALQEMLLWKHVVRKLHMASGHLALLCWWMGQAMFFQQVRYFVKSDIQENDT